MTKRFNYKQSLEEGEVVLENVQEATETEQDSYFEKQESVDIIEENTDVEAKVPTKVNSEPTPNTASQCQPTAAEIEFAKQFTGTPIAVDYSSIGLAQSCASKKLLAEFESGQFARGSLWYIHCRR